jgi:hypothetical protein
MVIIIGSVTFRNVRPEVNKTHAKSVVNYSVELTALSRELKAE